METGLIKFPSIEQSRQVLPEVIKTTQFTHVDPETNEPCYDQCIALPVIEFRGTVKLHGSNAAIVQTISSAPGEAIYFQSRNRILTMESDLVGFFAYMTGNIKAIASIFESISSALKCSGNESCQDEKTVKAIAIFGEWCGEGIQKGVAISKLPRMFVIFAVKVVYHDETLSTWLDLFNLPEVKHEPAGIFNIMQFTTYSLVIDFNDEDSLSRGKEKMTELTLGVEAECPVGKYFGVAGIGEGIVWQAIPSPNPSIFISGPYSKSKFWFKVKGDEHRNAGRKPAIKPATDPEKVSKIGAFVDLVVTPGRLQQGLEVLERELLLPLEMKSISAFIQWVKKDVIKEEYDRIAESELSEREISIAVSHAAKKWYVENLKA